LTAAIDDVDNSIVSNQTELKIYKKIVPFLGINQNITIRFGVPLFSSIPEFTNNHPASDIHAISSSQFTYQGQLVELEDNGNGVVNIVTNNRGNHSVVKQIGTVDYTTGEIKITDFNIDSFENGEIKIYGLPEFDDISVVGNNIFTLGLEELVVNVKTVRE
jgi:hypothetical protein